MSIHNFNIQNLEDYLNKIFDLDFLSKQYDLKLEILDFELQLEKLIETRDRMNSLQAHIEESKC